MRGIIKTFHSAGNFHALRGIDPDFRPGQFVSVVGRSGSGKSTLVNMITGIDRPTAGTVAIGGTLVHALNESEMARWRGATWASSSSSTNSCPCSPCWRT